MIKKIFVFILAVLFLGMASLLLYRSLVQEKSKQSLGVRKLASTSSSQAAKVVGGIADYSNATHLTILYTGNTQSYLEPCGCYVGQSGGAARRGTLVDKARKEGVGLLVLDAGGILDDKTFLDRLRGETYLKAMKIIGYDAINVSSEELRFGLSFLEEVSKKESLPFVSTNLLLPPNVNLRLQPYLLKEISGVRIAVLGVSQPNSDNPKWQGPLSALERTISKVKDSADLIVLLSSLSTKVNRRLASELEKVDLIISSHEGETEMAETVDQTILAYSSLHGKYLGRIDLKIKEAGIIGHEATYLSMDVRIPDHPQVQSILTQFYENVASNPELQRSTNRLFADQPHEQNSRNGYVDAQSCQPCHTKEYDQWQTTEHAFAYNTLLEKQRHFYPECVSCHTTGFGYDTGYRIGQANDMLANVQCETCHGPGKEHIAQPKKANIRKAVPVKLCAQCHNEEHSPNFEARAKEMIPLVDHSRKPSKAGDLIAQRVGVQNKVKAELFVMSQCPYGTAAEKEIIPTVKEYRDRVDFQIYHIAKEVRTGTSGGRRPFTSLHGQEEIEEGVRQVVIAKYYPQQLLDYLLCRTKNFLDAKAWIDCAKSLGIDVEKVRKIINGTEGEALFRENIQRGRMLSIDTSPTLIIDDYRYTNELFKKSSCYQKSDLVPIRYHIKNFPIQFIMGTSGLKEIPTKEYASLFATLDGIRQKLNQEPASTSQLQQIMSFHEEVKTLTDLLQKYPSNLYIGMLLAEVYREQGMQKLAAQQYKDLGFILNNEWTLIGPFETNRWGSGFRKRYPPEKEINFKALYKGVGKQKVGWTKPGYETVSAYVDLKSVFKSDVCASYALAVVEAPMEMDAQIRLAAFGMAKLWLNDKQVLSKKEWDRFQMDGDVATVKLQKGSNNILLKVIAQGIQNGFILRITDLKGQPIPELKIVDLVPNA